MKKVLAVALIAAALITMVIVPAGAELTSEEQFQNDSEPIKCPECGQQLNNTDSDGNNTPMTWSDIKDTINYDTADNYTHYCDNCQTEVTLHFWACKYSNCRICLPTNPGDVCPNCHAYQVIPADIQEMIYGAGDAENAYYAGTVFGYEKGNATGSDGGYEAGYNAGYEAGKSEGAGSSGESGGSEGSDAYQAGLAAGRQQVLDELEATATTNKYYLAGVNAGYSKGYTEGYEKGHKAGYNSGYKVGYDEGYQNALKKTANKFQFGVFAYCHFNAILGIPDSSGATQTYTISDVNMSFGYGYVYCGNQTVTQINNAIKSATGKAPEYDLAGLDWIKIECIFESSFDFRSQPLYITGDSDIQDLTVYSVSEDVASCGYEYNSSGAFSQFKLPDSWNGPFHCKKAVLYIGRPVDLLQAFSLYSPSGQFFTGYDVGYADGAKETAEDARQEGYKSGYTNGVIDGKKEGISISNSGEFGNLIAAVVDAPVNTFQSMFNFEILGMNMQKAIGAVLALCVVAIIIKKVVL